MNRRRMLNALKAEVGEYEDAAVLPVETDPQIYLSRNRQPQPFHLICAKDNVLAQLSGAAHVHLRDSSVNRFRMDVGDHVYIPAGTPHRIVPVAEGVTLRYQPQDAGLQGAAWYCDGCDSELRRYEWEHDDDTPAVQYYAAACARFSADEAARTCGKCGTVAAPLDLAAFGWGRRLSTMAGQEPGLEQIQEDITGLLRDEEIATLATVDADGHPSASTMHIAGDGLSVYIHTFSYNRKYAEMLADPRVSYAVSYLPPGGFDDRFASRSLQVKGRATLLTAAGEIQQAVVVSREQFPWLAQTAMYDNVKLPDQGQQVFFRIDPVNAVWADHRVRLLWRVFLEFDASGTRITGKRPYDAMVGRRNHG